MDGEAMFRPKWTTATICLTHTPPQIGTYVDLRKVLFISLSDFVG